MDIQSLHGPILDKTARLAVIGLGYVGLPIAALFAESGFDVLGVEAKPDRVEKINAGLSPIEGEEPGLAELLAEVVATGRLRATVDYEQLRDRDVILVDVETPVEEDHIPQYRALRSALHSLGPVLKPGALVIIESTIAPGTMRNIVWPLLEESSHMKLDNGFFLGNCPERVMPGKLLANLRTLSRVVGGGTLDTAEVMVALYQSIVQADLDPVDWITAELVKTVENAYRDVQIAFANEVALICEALGGNVWEVRELVNKSPYRQMHLPGAGVGGHCIPKDPWLLVHGVAGKDIPLKLIPAARAVNDGMPEHMVELIKAGLKEAGRELASSRILILGYAYLEDSDDTRNSPSKVLVQRLQELGAEVRVHDPYVRDYQGDLLQKAVDCDVAVAVVRHHEYLSLNLTWLKSVMRTPVLVDGRSIFSPEIMKNLSFIYKAIGQPQHPQWTGE